MEVSRIEAEHLLVLDRVTEIKLVRADHVAFRADSKQLAFHSIEMKFGIERLGEDFVQRAAEKFARRPPVGRQVLVAVWNPDVGDARRAQLAAEPLPNLAADDSVGDPEAANAFIAAGEREAGIGLRVREKCAVEIESQLVVLRPVDPAAEEFRANYVTLDPLAAVIAVNRVQIEPMLARNEGQR